MEFVDPIRDKKKIAQIKNLLRGEGRYRDLLLFTVGVNSALRVSDLVQLQVHDFVDTEGNMQDSFRVREEKTDKGRIVTINDAMTDAFREYLVAYPGIVANPDNHLFFNVKTGHFDEPIGRKMVWVFMSEICAAVGLKGNYGSHTLRKTWGYHARISGVPLSFIMEMLNHSSEKVTLRYLGITADELAEVARNLNI